MSLDEYTIHDGRIDFERIKTLVAVSDPVILEVGCNTGTDTIKFLKYFDSPTIYCFEPEPRAVERFKKTVPRVANVTLIEAAVSDHTGSTVFYRSGGTKDMIDRPYEEQWHLSGSIREPKKHLEFIPWVSFEKTLTVNTVTLDIWMQSTELQLIDFIWMDVQGAERNVIRGGKECLSRTRFLYTEYNNNEMYEGQWQLQQIMENLPDFEVLTVYKNDVLLRNRSL